MDYSTEQPEQPIEPVARDDEEIKRSGHSSEQARIAWLARRVAELTRRYPANEDFKILEKSTNAQTAKINEEKRGLLEKIREDLDKAKELLNTTIKQFNTVKTHVASALTGATHLLNSAQLESKIATYRDMARKTREWFLSPEEEAQAQENKRKAEESLNKLFKEIDEHIQTAKTLIESAQATILPENFDTDLFRGLRETIKQYQAIADTTEDPTLEEFEAYKTKLREHIEQVPTYITRKLEEIRDLLAQKTKKQQQR